MYTVEFEINLADGLAKQFIKHAWYSLLLKRVMIVESGFASSRVNFEIREGAMRHIKTDGKSIYTKGPIRRADVLNTLKSVFMNDHERYARRTGMGS